MHRFLVTLAILLGLTSAALAAEPWKKGTKESVLMEQGAVRLSASQVRSLVVGSTEGAKYDRAKWPITYYAPDGSMHIKRPNGKRNVEPYKLRSDGGVCYGPTFNRCHYFLRLKGELIIVRFGRVLGVAKMERGKRL